MQKVAIEGIFKQTAAAFAARGGSPTPNCLMRFYCES